jgi:ubiquinol-cytochrome c reductase iron-sulfur subunit
MSIMTEHCIDHQRRRLFVATAAAGGLGTAITLVPFVSSMLPSERARATGAPVEVDIGTLQPGQMMTVEWRGKPVWVLHRTPEMLATLPKLAEQVSDPVSAMNQQPEYCRSEHRSIKPEFFVAIGICTHLGCSPGSRFASGTADGMDSNWPGGFFCPCHGSTFDLAGRVFKNKPAPTNLEIPIHDYLTETRLLIGEERRPT